MIIDLIFTNTDHLEHIERLCTKHEVIVSQSGTDGKRLIVGVARAFAAP